MSSFQIFRNFPSVSMNFHKKNKFSLSRIMAIGAATASLSCCPLMAAGATASDDLAAQISSSGAFYLPLAWVGSAPPANEENQELWAEIRKINLRGAEPSIAFLQEFVSARPNSPWTPSIRANQVDF